MRVLFKIFTLTFVLAFGFPTLVFPQTVEGSARTIGMGGAGTALVEDVYGNLNPASRGGLGQTTVSFGGSQGFGLAELRTGEAAAGIRTAFGNIGLNAQAFGFDAYREMRFSLGYGKGVTLGSTRNFNIGAMVNYQQVSIPDYGSSAAVGLSVGVQLRMTDHVSLGMQASNVNRPKYAENEDLARAMRVGISYMAAENMLFVLDVVKDVRFPVSVHSGFEFRPVSALAIRGGIATAPVRYSAGVGFKLGKIGADVAAQRHQTLGWTPALSLSVSL
jgi:hypothetical protein